MRCPESLTELPRTTKFCGECGHDLRKPKEACAIDYACPASYTSKHLADKILTSRTSIAVPRPDRGWFANAAGGPEVGSA